MGDEPQPGSLGEFLRNAMGLSDGPPWTHVFQPPEPVPVPDDDGQQVVDEAGEPVTSWALGPSYSLTHVWEPTAAEAVEMIRIDDERLFYGRAPETPVQRVRRVLDAAGWTDETLRGVQGAER